MEFWRWWFTKGINIQYFPVGPKHIKKKMHQESLRATLSMVLCRRGFLEESFTGFLDEFLFLLKKSAKKNWCSKTICFFFCPAQPKACALKTVSFWKVFGEIFSAGDCGGVEVGSIFFYIDLKKRKTHWLKLLEGITTWQMVFRCSNLDFNCPKTVPMIYFWGFWLDKMEKTMKSQRGWFRQIVDRRNPAKQLMILCIFSRYFLIFFSLPTPGRAC